jgi:imidazolonepropionase-like amidohydrolase
MKTKMFFLLSLVIPLTLIISPLVGRASASKLASEQKQADTKTAFVNVNVIPMDTKQVLENQTVIVEGDRIVAVGPADEITVPQNAVVVDGAGKYLIPGLADMHFHAWSRRQALTLALAYGVTTIRNFNAYPEDLELARQIEAGELLGPTYYNGWSIGDAPPNYLIIRLMQIGGGLALGILLFLIALVALYVTGRAEMARRLLLRKILIWIGVVLGASVLFAYTEIMPEEPYILMIGKDGATSSPERAASFVHKYSAAGIDFIKVNQNLSREVFDAIVATAKEEGLPITGHISSEVGLEYFLNAGADIQHTTEIAPFMSQAAIYDQPLREHDLLLVDERMPQLVALYVRNGGSFTPTIGLINHARMHLDDDRFAANFARPEIKLMPPMEWQGMDDPEKNFVRKHFAGKESYLDKFQVFEKRLVMELFDAGVPILAGSDVTSAPGMVYGESLIVELEMLVQAGLTPYQALDAATRTPAVAMGDMNEWGTIEVGKRADMVLLSANPLEDIGNTRQIEGVMARGNWLPQSKIQEMLSELPASYETMGDPRE